jgi:SAM-dependent methyltransferase
MSDPDFSDPLILRALYGSAARLERRIAGIKGAKTRGGNPHDQIAAIAARRVGRGAIVAELGCGNGSLLERLARAMQPRQLYAIDQSADLLAIARRRLNGVADCHYRVCDFLEGLVGLNGVDLTISAFALYHAARPSQVVERMVDVLAPGGACIVATKSRDSYAALDRLLECAGLDPEATRRPGLYERFHNENLLDSCPDRKVEEVHDEIHEFAFLSPTEALDYAQTSPKYRWQPLEQAERLARLGRVWPAAGRLIVHSTVRIAVLVR